MIIYKDIEQGSAEWHNIRLGKVTGTRVKEALSANHLSLVDEIIGEMISEQSEDEYVSAIMQRGSDYEPLARRAYSENTGLEVDQIGFIQSSKYEWLGMSPDGKVKINNTYRHGIEIKCPKTSTHVKYIRQNQVPADHKCQVMSMYLINPDLETHDFISYDPRFSVKPLFIFRTDRDTYKEELKVMEESLVKFWDKVMKYYNQVTF